MDQRHKLGKAGEAAAREHLAAKGFEIISTNWRFLHFEVDIIAKKDDVIVIVEVKTRMTDDYGHPSVFMTRRQELHLIESADHYLSSQQLTNEVRFDVITVLPAAEGFVIEHFCDAFTAF